MSTGRVAEMLDPHIPTWGVREIYQGVTTSTLAHGLLVKTSKHSMEIRIDRQIDRSSSHSRIYPAPPPKKKSDAYIEIVFITTELIGSNYPANLVN